MIESLLNKENCLENSDGEELDDLNNEWTDLIGVKEEKTLEEDIGDLEQLDSDEEQEQEQMKMRKGNSALASSPPPPALA